MCHKNKKIKKVQKIKCEKTKYKIEALILWNLQEKKVGEKVNLKKCSTSCPFYDASPEYFDRHCTHMLAEGRWEVIQPLDECKIQASEYADKITIILFLEKLVFRNNMG